MTSQITIAEDRLEMVRLFKAPRERVFNAFRQTEWLQQWWGCQGTTSVKSENDFREGGRFTHKMQVANCGEVAYSGTYDEIIEGEKISWHGEFGGCMTQVTVEFVPQGAHTKMTLTQEGFPAGEMCQFVSDGFTASFDRLDQLLARDA
jgi:uncharacterized protein YndB with AHSA1/START domain